MITPNAILVATFILGVIVGWGCAAYHWRR